MFINFRIGEYYKYPNSKDKFKLIESRGFTFRFECGHWCTDNVFVGLIRCKTNIQVYEDLQMEFDFNQKNINDV